jgi:hypothetical protein
MGRPGALFGRRVPLYLSIPIVVACGVTGYAVGTKALLSTAASQARLRQLRHELGCQCDPKSLMWRYFIFWRHVLGKNMWC